MTHLLVTAVVVRCESATGGKGVTVCETEAELLTAVLLGLNDPTATVTIEHVKVTLVKASR